MIRSFVLLILTPLLLSGCGRDHEADVDSKVTEEWMQDGMYVDAIEYLEDGGEYDDVEAADGTPELEAAAILPFFRRLKEEFDFDQYAILIEDADYCWGFVVKLPDDAAKRKEFQAFLESENESFPGLILEEWGHEWLSLDFLDEQAAKVVREGQEAAAAS
jgi:hypothetical protein